MADLVVTAVEAPHALATTVMEALASVACDGGARDGGACDGGACDGGAFPEEAYIRAARSNIISRDALVQGAANVSIAGDGVVRPGAIIRGDLARVRVGRYVDVGAGAILRPAARATVDDPPALAYVPQLIGSHVSIGSDAVVEAAAVGLGAVVGARAVVGKSVVLKDYCVVAADSIVPDDVVCAPFSILAGAPAVVVGHLPPSAADERRREAQAEAARRRRAVASARGGA